MSVFLKGHLWNTIGKEMALTPNFFRMLTQPTLQVVQLPPITQRGNTLSTPDKANQLTRCHGYQVNLGQECIKMVLLSPLMKWLTLRKCLQRTVGSPGYMK